MPLTVTFDEYNGAAETKTDSISAIAFSSTDAPAPTSHDYPIRPTDASYVKYIKIDFADFSGAGVSTVSDTRVYLSQGVLAAGETLLYKGLGPIVYAVPTQADTSDSAIPTTLPGAQNLALNGADDGSLSADGSSDYMRFQRTVDGTTPIGTLAPVVITVQYTTA